MLSYYSPISKSTTSIKLYIDYSKKENNGTMKGPYDLYVLTRLYISSWARIITFEFNTRKESPVVNLGYNFRLNPVFMI